jgi:PAS domain S-box-containing protein
MGDGANRVTFDGPSLTTDTSREGEERSRLVVDSLPGMVAVFAADGTLEFVNRQLLEYFGSTLDELRDRGTGGFVHPEDLPAAAQAFAHSIASGEPFEIELRTRRFDGAYRWVQSRGSPLKGADGRPASWYNLLTDIDERKRAEDVLSASQRNLQRTIDTIPAVVWSARPDGWADFFSQHYLNYVGFPFEKALGWGWTEAIHPDDLPKLLDIWQAVSAAGKAGDAEARIRRHDGVYRRFLFRANPLHDEQGNVVKWYGVNTDIEDRHVSEEALEQVRSELAQVTRVMSLSTLTASIAHEVNQPLSGIITNAGTCLRMLSSKTPDIDGARETARRTIRDGNRAADVIGRLRSLFSKKTSTHEAVDLNEAAREVLALMAGDLRRSRVTLRTDFEAGLPPVLADRIQLQQVIMNLLRNACDAMSDTDDRQRKLQLSTELDSERSVQLSMRDVGIGLGKNSAEKVFEPFYTTKHAGMGIGLAVSRSIIERHGGRIWAEANDGPGVTFCFCVPIDVRNETEGTDRR